MLGYCEKCTLHADQCRCGGVATLRRDLSSEKKPAAITWYAGLSVSNTGKVSRFIFVSDAEVLASIRAHAKEAWAMYKYAVFGFDAEAGVWRYLATADTTGDADDVMAEPMYSNHYARMRKCRILDATSAYIEMKLEELNEAERAN